MAGEDAIWLSERDAVSVTDFAGGGEWLTVILASLTGITTRARGMIYGGPPRGYNGGWLGLCEARFFAGGYSRSAFRAAAGYGNGIVIVYGEVVAFVLRGEVDC